jgi:glycine dehydrogenase subunit 1
MTAYTPYQPEVSQGTLQAIFEFQTLICQLFGMEIANASMYDGASATAEAALMAMRIKQIPRILVAQSLHPQYRETLQTYITHLGTELVEIGWDRSGAIDESGLQAVTKEPASALIVQYPNFFGVVEPLDRWAKIAHEANMLLVVAVTEATSLGLLKPPGAFDADIVTGEGQAFGIPLSFGGAYLGLFASKKSFVRQMPGRLVGETVDREGNRAFVVTLATREQHIRRAKATSNICTNQGLFALAATIYLATLGKNGLRDLAFLNLQRASAFRKELEKLPGIEFPFSGSTFNEFVIRIDRDANLLLQRLLEKRIVGGLDLGRFYPQFKNHLLVTVTETTPKEAWEGWKEAYLQGARHA